MPRRKPQIMTIDRVRIRRENNVAAIQPLDSDAAVVHLNIGPMGRNLTDEQILDLYNATVRAQQEHAAAYRHVSVEVPLGQPQIRYHKGADQWSPRGDVLRCLVEDGGPDGELTVVIDDRELSLDEFGRMLCTYAGWGMRIEFVPADDIDKRPELEVREPDSE